jgi:hypothetical protein
MSIYSANGIAIAVAGTVLDTVLIRHKRNIAGIFPDVTIQETHEDELEITSHPTEGGNVSEHAFMRPVELTMHVAWSDSKPLQTLIKDGLNGSFGSSVRDVYQQLLDLQKSRVPFAVVTGKRSYENMLVSSIRVDTSLATENSLVADIHFKEVIIVHTQTQLLPSSDLQASPQKTNPPANTGTKQPVQTS